MNSTSLGLQSSWWVAVLLIVLSFGFSFWYYRQTNPPLRSTTRLLLSVLRGLGLSLLLFVLLEPVLSIMRSSSEAAQVAILLDNSASMSTRDAGGDRMERYREALSVKDLQSYLSSHTVQLFDESVRGIEHFELDSLSCKGQRSDIERALRFVADNAEASNTQAAILFTDGAFNSGSNPLYQAEQLAKPLYVVGIGDTAEPKDVSLLSLITNELSYVGSTIPVNLRFKAVGLGDRRVRISLSDNGQKVAETEVPISAKQHNYSASFEYKASADGIRKLSAQCEVVDGELTTKNNQLSEFIRVLSTKRKVALFAGAPSPDVSFIRSALEADHSIQLQCYIQKSGAEFYDQAPNSAALREAEQIMFIGFPIASTSQQVLQLVLEELKRNKPLLFITSQNVDYTKLRALEEFLPFSVQSSRTNEFSIMADVRSSAAANPLIRISGATEDLEKWNSLAPIFRTETFVRVKPEAEVVASMKVNNVPLSDPLIVSRRFQKAKSVAVLGYGLYRWKLLGNAADQARGKHDVVDVLSVFLQNSLKWLQANDDEKTVRIRTTRKQYSSSDKVEIVAQVYDAAMTPLDNASVTVKVSGAGVERDIVLSAVGSGRYTSIVEGLPEGDYSYQGSVALNNKAYGNDGGRFSIGDIPLEYQNLRMNSELLRTLAERSGGRFYLSSQTAQLLEDLQKNPRFTNRIVQFTSEYSLWNLAWLLAAALLAFSVEWFIRKRAGLI